MVDATATVVATTTHLQGVVQGPCGAWRCADFGATRDDTTTGDVEATMQQMAFAAGVRIRALQPLLLQMCQPN